MNRRALVWAVLCEGSDVMDVRRAWLLVFAFALLGCQTPVWNGREPFEHCSFDHREGWRLLQGRPDNAEAMLALKVQGEVLDIALTPPQRPNAVGVHEHWFSRGRGQVAVCRHLNVEQCSDFSRMAVLSKAGGAWSSDGVLETVCFGDSRNAPTAHKAEP